MPYMPFDDDSTSDDRFVERANMWRPPEASAYQPTWRDMVARGLLGAMGMDQQNLGPEMRRAMGGLIGSTGIGRTGIPITDASAIPHVADAATSLSHGNLTGALLSGLGAAVPVYKAGRMISRGIRNTGTRAHAAAVNSPYWMQRTGATTMQSRATPGQAIPMGDEAAEATYYGMRPGLNNYDAYYAAGQQARNDLAEQARNEAIRQMQARRAALANQYRLIDQGADGTNVIPFPNNNRGLLR